MGSSVLYAREIDINLFGSRMFIIGLRMFIKSTFSRIGSRSERIHRYCIVSIKCPVRPETKLKIPALCFKHSYLL